MFGLKLSISTDDEVRRWLEHSNPGFSNIWGTEFSIDCYYDSDLQDAFSLILPLMYLWSTLEIRV